VAKGYKPSVVIIEDDIALANSLTFYLNKKGYIIDHFPTGHSAMSHLTRKIVDVALIDITLPDTNGHSLLERIKKSTPNTKVIMFTNKDSIYKRLASLNSGADDYIPKPFSILELEARLSRLVQEHLRSSVKELKYKDLTIAREGELRHRKTSQTVRLSPIELNFLIRIIKDQTVEKEAEIKSKNKQRVLVTRINRKLEKVGSSVRIKSGYRTEYYLILLED